MLRKRIKSLTCVVVLMSALLTLFPVAAFADSFMEANVSVMQPRLNCIVEAENSLEIDGTTAIVDCSVTGNLQNATKAKVIAELQVKSGNNWIAYGTWVDTQNDYEAYVYETKSVKAGNTYRVKATFTVWEGSQSETVTSFTDEMTA